jgi:C1A family cysteine protease
MTPAVGPSERAEAGLSLSEAVDLRPRLQQWGLAPRRQGSRGTCSVFTVAGALEYAIACRQGQGQRLSVEFLNWAAHRAASRTADGGFFSELWEGYAAYGICPEVELPYREQYDAALEPDARALAAARDLQRLGLRWHWIKEWDVKSGLTDVQLTALKATLAHGWPVCGGFRWPKQPRWEQDVLQLCPPDEVFDGHSVLLVGYREEAQQPGGGLFLIRNSGGDGRDGSLPYDYVREYMNDAAWVEGDLP